MTVSPASPCPVLSVGITGHREGHPSWPSDPAGVAGAIVEILDIIEAARRESEAEVGCTVRHRLVGLLADGADRMAAEAALARDWQLLAPLPFGRDLAFALSCSPSTPEAAEALLAGKRAADPETHQRCSEFSDWLERAEVFELADADKEIAGLFLKTLHAPEDRGAAQVFGEQASLRYALAGSVMIEQSDLIIAVWDGEHLARIGGTGHTIAAALDNGGPVALIDPARPDSWRILQVPEDLVSPPSLDGREELLGTLVREAVCKAGGLDLRSGMTSLSNEPWPGRSSRWSSSYRRLEALFGGSGRRFRSLVQTYETPDAIAKGSGAPLLRAIAGLPGLPASFVERLENSVLRRFAWADGISAYLSDSYRGGMVLSFFLSAFAIIAGIAYQPFASDEHKWMFALTEFLTLVAILVITAVGVRRRWHSRWFETRRVGEYLRQAPILLALGVARAPGRWPKGINTSWPEAYALASMREVGVPQAPVTAAYLRQALVGIVDPHIASQRDYHIGKAHRLTHVHHVLDRISQRLFVGAVVSVAAYLILKGAAKLDLVPDDLPGSLSKLFTFLGVSLPTLGASLAGLRYFGDFERFAAISQVTAEKLDGLHARLQVMLTAPEADLRYPAVASLIHEMDQTVVSEIENWQAVFGGKQITVPA